MMLLLVIPVHAISPCFGLDGGAGGVPSYRAPLSSSMRVCETDVSGVSLRDKDDVEIPVHLVPWSNLGANPQVLVVPNGPLSPNSQYTLFSGPESDRGYTVSVLRFVTGDALDTPGRIPLRRIEYADIAEWLGTNLRLLIRMGGPDETEFVVFGMWFLREGETDRPDRPPDAESDQIVRGGKLAAVRFYLPEDLTTPTKAVIGVRTPGGVWIGGVTPLTFDPVARQVTLPPETAGCMAPVADLGHGQPNSLDAPGCPSDGAGAVPHRRGQADTYGGDGPRRRVPRFRGVLYANASGVQRENLDLLLMLTPGRTAVPMTVSVWYGPDVATDGWHAPAPRPARAPDVNVSIPPFNGELLRVSVPVPGLLEASGAVRLSLSDSTGQALGPDDEVSTGPLFRASAALMMCVMDLSAEAYLLRHGYPRSFWRNLSADTPKECR